MSSTVADHQIVGKVRRRVRSAPTSPRRRTVLQVWFTLKDTGKTQVFNAQPPFNLLKTLDTGPITNHVNIVRNANGMFAYVTVGGLNEVKVFRTDNFEQVATIPTGKLPHGIWPSGDGTRVYVGLENEDRIAAIDTLTNKVIATSPVGQAPQAVVYVPNAVPDGPGTQGLQPLGVAGKSEQLQLAPPGAKAGEKAPTSVSLSDQGLVQVLEAAVTGSIRESLTCLRFRMSQRALVPWNRCKGFMTNPAGSAIVNAIGPIRQVVRGEDKMRRRYLVIAPGTAEQHGARSGSGGMTAPE